MFFKVTMGFLIVTGTFHSSGYAFICLVFVYFGSSSKVRGLMPLYLYGVHTYALYGYVALNADVFFPAAASCL